ncbi:MAG: hypothetical protein ACREJM_02975, partial [Candidatus Saccharimonadales bacterium]
TSTFPNSTVILRPDSWLALARESGPLLSRDRQVTAEQAIAAGYADLISFGRPFISNPDLVERFKNDWPLAEPAPMSDWYLPTGAKGYTDFPTYAPSTSRS